MPIKLTIAELELLQELDGYLRPEDFYCDNAINVWHGLMDKVYNRMYELYKEHRYE